ncbi:PE-PPE domain-containing protein [Gordonia phage Fairfaxidum]|uniref:Lysin B n=1 Tax=Gordonia phage Fairfaxidum TaxID=2572526 RepID=A0A4D6T6F4_9CAUD|nr:PE-PPE domain-containing protein [Gordonia phage Fairfaxidum]QCG77608.1 lysin B [Gordonia phage Fairfaxidum]
MSATVLMVDGTWSKPGARSSAAESLKRSLRPGFDFRYVDYPAMFGPATGLRDMSAAESIAQGVRNLTRAVEQTTGPIVIACYSQGFIVGYRFVREVLQRRPELRENVRALAGMGNPHEPTHHGRGGIAQRLKLPDGLPLLSVWVPGDPIADIEVNAPLRSVWDLTEWMSVRDLPSARRWLDDVTDQVTDGPQEWWQHPDILGSLRAANRYVFGTQHSQDYARHGHATRLARMIERVA